MLEERVARLEDAVGRMENIMRSAELSLAEIKAELRQAPKAADYAGLKAEIAEMRGHLRTLPTWWMLIIAVIATWGAGSAIVFALTRTVP
ncbi:hypothetical protein [Prosthecomicrobium pneumaticum]|uniref:Uncharacterized protein n=1 Tax=Prosthecomicrobium pneumaticum TaxID=81895 RepID=A0A7W9CW27_9HYPH|nr:hypothetical protein [Prosthecomicrobium pneumaticum]MBB5752626.1 hypothetical protein [Prosthecomicrobium pneumaticum]